MLDSNVRCGGAWTALRVLSWNCRKNWAYPLTTARGIGWPANPKLVAFVPSEWISTVGSSSLPRRPAQHGSDCIGMPCGMVWSFRRYPLSVPLRTRPNWCVESCPGGFRSRKSFTCQPHRVTANTTADGPSTSPRRVLLRWKKNSNRVRRTNGCSCGHPHWVSGSHSRATTVTGSFMSRGIGISRVGARAGLSELSPKPGWFAAPALKAWPRDRTAGESVPVRVGSVKP